jgi:hypothetical protein
MFKVVCINAQNKPDKIPLTEWLIQGEIYTVRKVVNMALMNNQVGFELEEVSLSPDSFPYEYYSASRFIPLEIYEKQEITVKEEELDLSII